jgi:hypothetical protein
LISLNLNINIDSWENFRRDYYDTKSPPVGGPDKESCMKRDSQGLKNIMKEESAQN